MRRIERDGLLATLLVYFFFFVYLRMSCDVMARAIENDMCVLWYHIARIIGILLQALRPIGMLFSFN